MYHDITLLKCSRYYNTILKAASAEHSNGDFIDRDRAKRIRTDDQKKDCPKLFLCQCCYYVQKHITVGFFCLFLQYVIKISSQYVDIVRFILC